MLRFVISKVGVAIAILAVVTLGVSALIELIPGSPAALALGNSSQPGALAAFNHEHGYDKPFFVRYWDWLTAALHGNFGTSVQDNAPVVSILGAHFGVTIEITVLALVLSLLIAVPLAVYCAAHEDGAADRIVTAVSSGLFSLPVFITSVFLSDLLAARLRILPTFGWVSLSQNPGQNLRYAAMPVIALAAIAAPLFLRVLRADVVGMLRQDFVLNARAKGLPDRYILFRHVLRPASTSLLTLSALIFGLLMGGSVVVETYFAVPGIGEVISSAVTAKDLPVVQGVVVIVALIYLALNTLVDVAQVALDPRLAQRR